MPWFDVHHRVADLQLRQVLDQRVDAGDLFLLATAPRLRRAGEELGLGDELDGKARVRRLPMKAGSQRRGGDGDLVAAGQEVGQRADAGHGDLVVAQQVEQALAPAFALGHQQHAVRGRVQVTLERGQRLGGVAVHRHVGQRPGPGDRASGVVAAQRQRGMSLRAGEELVGLQEDRFGRQQRPLRVVLQEPVALAGVGPEVLEGGVHLAVQNQRGVGTQVVEQRGRLVEEQRQVVLDAARGDALLDVLVDARTGGVAFELFAPARAERGARRLVERKLAAGQQPHLGHRIQAALAVGVEGADRIDLVVVQVDPERHRRAHREQVDQAAAHRVLARRHDLAHVLVAGEHQLRLQPGLVQPLLLLEQEGGGGQEAGRREPGQRGGGGQQHDVDLALQHLPQGGQAFGDQVLVRAEGVVGQGLPVGKHRHPQCRVEEGQLVGQALGVGGLGTDDGQRPLPAGLGVAREPGQSAARRRCRSGAAG